VQSEATVLEMPAGGVRRFEPAAEKPAERPPAERKRSRSARRPAPRSAAPTGGLRGRIRDVRDLPAREQKENKASAKQASAQVSSKRSAAHGEASGRTKAAKPVVTASHQVTRCKVDDDSQYSEDYYSESGSESPSQQQVAPERLQLRQQKQRQQPVSAKKKRKAVLCAAQARPVSPPPRSPDSRSRLPRSAAVRGMDGSRAALLSRDEQRTWQGGRYNHFDDEWHEEEYWYDWDWNDDWGRGGGGRKGGFRDRDGGGKGSEQRRSWGHGGKGGGKDRREGGKGGNAFNTSRIHVSNLPRHVREDVVWSLFQDYGQVLGVKILSPSGANKSWSAIVRFGDSSAAKASISALHGRHELSPGGGAIEVKPAWPNPKWET